jgi:hypothetical protein
MRTIKMQMNQSMVDWYKAQVIAAVARKLNIPDWDFMDSDEQFKAIQESYPEIGDLLEVFLGKYDEWWSFQEEHKADIEKSGLKPEHLPRNMELMDARDSSREQLRQAVNGR